MIPDSQRVGTRLLEAVNRDHRLDTRHGQADRVHESGTLHAPAGIILQVVWHQVGGVPLSGIRHKQVHLDDTHLNPVEECLQIDTLPDPADKTPQVDILQCLADITPQADILLSPADITPQADILLDWVEKTPQTDILLVRVDTPPLRNMHPGSIILLFLI